MKFTKWMIFLGVASLGGWALSTGCVYDKKDVALVRDTTHHTPVSTCDTGTVTYSKQISSIISNNCLSCHGANVANSSGGHINLEGYQNLKDNWGDSVLGNPQVLLDDINQIAGANAMPKSGRKLTDCEIAQYQKWVNTGCAQ